MDNLELFNIGLSSGQPTSQHELEFGGLANQRASCASGNLHALQSLQQAVDSLNTLNTTCLGSQSTNALSSRDIISDAEVKAFMFANMTGTLASTATTAVTNSNGTTEATAGLPPSELKFSPKHATQSTPDLSASVLDDQDMLTRTRSTELRLATSNSIPGRASPGLAKRVSTVSLSDTAPEQAENGDCYVGMRLASGGLSDSFNGEAKLASSRPFFTAPKMADFNEEVLTEIPLVDNPPEVEISYPPEVDHLCPDPSFEIMRTSVGSVTSAGANRPAGGVKRDSSVMPNVADGLSSGSDMDSPQASPCIARPAVVSSHRPSHFPSSSLPSSQLQHQCRAPSSVTSVTSVSSLTPTTPCGTLAPPGDPVWVKRGDSPSDEAIKEHSTTPGTPTRPPNKDAPCPQVAASNRPNSTRSNMPSDAVVNGRHRGDKGGGPRMLCARGAGSDCEMEAQHWTFPPSNHNVYSSSDSGGGDGEEDPSTPSSSSEQDSDEQTAHVTHPPRHHANCKAGRGLTEEEKQHNSYFKRRMMTAGVPLAPPQTRRLGGGGKVENSRVCEAPSQPIQQDGEYESDEDTEKLLQKEYQREEATEIPELAQQRALSEKKRKGREVAVRHPNHPTVLIEGVLFRASYLGSTQLVSEGQPSKATRMIQAQEAVGRIKVLGKLHFGEHYQAPEGENQPSVAVDLFVSTEKIMVLNTNLQEIMMDHALRTISYIADIGDILVLMARRRFLPSGSTPEDDSDLLTPTGRRRHTRIICHVFESDEAQLIAQSIGQAFQVAYLDFLKANGIDDPQMFKEMDYQEVLNQQEIYAEELHLFADKEMQKEVIVPKQRSEPLGVVIVESGWGSLLPTVVLANMNATGPAARCGQLNIGNQIIAINGHSLVGLPLSNCQQQIKSCRHQTSVKLTVVSCPPVVEVLIKRPDVKYQLGFSVQNGVICSLLRGGIAERGGIRVGHRIIEINGQSVVAITHDRIVNMLATAIGEIHLRTMPTSIFRLLTGQDTPHYI